MVAKRGIMFEFDTSIAPGAERALEAIEKRVDAIQKRMHLTLDVTERAGRRTGGATNGAYGGNGGGNGNGIANGSGGSVAVSDAAAKAAERAALARERAAERAMRIEARWNRMAEAAVEKREQAEARAADKTEREAKRAADAQIREAKRAENEKQKGFAAAARRQQAEALREHRADKSFWRGFEKYGADRAKTKRDEDKKAAAEQRNAERERKAAEREIETAARRQAETQTRIREGIYDTVHAFGQLTRAAAQFGLVGQRDMMKVLDTIFAIEGSINALQGVMGAARAIGGIRAARAAAAGTGAAKYAAVPARLGGVVAGTGGAGIGVGGSGAAVGGVAGGATSIGGGALAVGGAGLSAAGGIGAALLSGAATGREMASSGFMGGAHVGGAVDRYAGGVASTVGWVHRKMLEAQVFGEHQANAPFGLSSHERIRRSQKVLEGRALTEREQGEGGIGSLLHSGFRHLGNFGWMLGGRKSLSVLGNVFGAEQTKNKMRSEGEMQMASESAASRRKLIVGADLEARTKGRGEMERRAGRFALEAREFGFKQSLRGEREGITRGFIGERFERQQAAHEERLGLQQRAAFGEYVNPVQAARAKAEEIRERDRVQSHERSVLEGLRLQRTAASNRHHRLKGQLGEAQERYREAFSPDAKENARQEIEEKQRQINEIIEDRSRIVKRIGQEEIAGAQRTLQLRKQDYATAKQTADVLRNRKQSFRETLGGMLPQQQMALADATQAMSRGNANRLQRELVEQYAPDLFRQEIREDKERHIIPEALRRIEESAGNFNRELGAAEGEEKAGEKVTFEGKNRIEVDVNANFEEFSGGILRLIEQQLKPMWQKMEEALEQKSKNLEAEVKDSINQAGRQMWGGLA